MKANKTYGKFIILGTVCLLGFMSYLSWQLARSRTVQVFGGLIPRVATQEKLVALTFDDGPTAYTDEILAILEEQEVKVTFFVTGVEMKRNIEEGKKLVQAGHQLGNHSYSHKRMLLKSQSFIDKELKETDKLIRQAGYEGKIYFRPPYGKKFVALPYYLSEQGRETVMWDVEPEMYPEKAYDSKKVVSNTLENVKPGSIVLMHVMYKGGAKSRNALKDLIIGLKEKGYKLVTLSELMEYYNTANSAKEI